LGGLGWGHYGFVWFGEDHIELVNRVKRNASPLYEVWVAGAFSGASPHCDPAEATSECLDSTCPGASGFVV
jgi:hypothetical protein